MSEFINNTEHRQQLLKKIIKGLHDGLDLEAAKIEFKKEKHFNEVSTAEISNDGTSPPLKKVWLLKKFKIYVMCMLLYLMVRFQISTQQKIIQKSKATQYKFS